eukprot:g5526.t1
MRKQRINTKKRNLLILIRKHLADHGYIEALEAFEKDAGVHCKNFEAAENVDLLYCLQEFEEYYELKFNRKVKLTKRLRGGPASGSSLNAIRSRTPPNPPAGENIDKEEQNKPPSPGLLINGSAIEEPPKKAEKGPMGFDTIDEHATDRLLKPLPYADKETRDLAASITRDIFTVNPNVYFADVIGHASAKRILRESVVMPIRYPQLFTGILSPWKGACIRYLQFCCMCMDLS